MNGTDTQNLEQLAADASGRIAACADLPALEGLKVELFGKKGAITALLKSLGGLAPDARREAGARINAARDDLAALVAERQAGLEQEAMERELAAGRIDVTTLFREHHRKWKRRSRAMVNPNIRTGVEFEETPGYTIIDVYAPDSVGFLYRVTEAISRLRLNIVFAKIATRVDGIVDSFYVLEQSGGPVVDEARRAHIGTQILATVKRTTEMGPA